ncbi:thymidine phosphorylase, partial [Suipraeoptans intestinalis]
NQTGLSIIGQTGNLAPADKKLYALRDVTATVDSIPLIAVSIMSKKLAAGSDAILLDVKTGSGAFMKTLEDSIALAKEMVSIGENAGRKTAALITDMDIPLGNNIGNSLEVMEAVETLKGNGPADLTEVCIHLAGNMLYLAGKGTIEECMALAKAKIEDGSALERLAAMVEAQGGDASVILDPSRFAKAPYSMQVFAEKEGYIGAMDTEGCGIASSMLGAGRQTKDSAIDPAAGIVLKRKVGDYVTKEDVIAVLYTSDSSLLEQAQKKYVSSVRIQVEAPKKEPLIYARVTKEAVERF